MKRTAVILLTVALCLLACAALAEDALPTATVAAGTGLLTMRNMPNSDGEVICGIPVGETVTILTDGGFPFVEYDRFRGFVDGQYLIRDPDAVHKDWMDCGVYVLSSESFLSIEEINTLKKRIDEFQKNTQNFFLLVVVSNDSLSHEQLQNILNTTANDFMARVMDSEAAERTAQWINGPSKGAFTAAFNTADYSLCNNLGGESWNILYGDDGEKHWNELDNAFIKALNHWQSWEKLLADYIDAVEELFK